MEINTQTYREIAYHKSVSEISVYALVRKNQCKYDDIYAYMPEMWLKLGTKGY